MTSPLQDICGNCGQSKSSGLCTCHCFICGRPRLRKFRALTPLDNIAFGYCDTNHAGPGLIKRFAEQACEWAGLGIAFVFSAIKICQNYLKSVYLLFRFNLTRREDRAISEAEKDSHAPISYKDNVKLTKRFNDSNGHVRLDAVRELGKRRDPYAVDLLIRALGDKEDYIRWNAAEALGIIGNVGAIDSLIKALDDSHSLVRKSALEALRKFEDEKAESAVKRLEKEKRG